MPHLKTYQNKATKINHILLILFAFSLPISIAINNILAVFIVVTWIIEGNFRDKFSEILSNKVALIVMFFVAMHIIGFMWTDDVSTGLVVLKKEVKFLLLPIFMTIVKKHNIKYYIYAFLSAITISEVFSYLVWFELIPTFGHATVGNPTPFIDHIAYNPFLAFATYILAYLILFEKHTSSKQKIIYFIFIITISVNMFITGGRAGQIMYFAVIAIVLLQYFNKQKFKAIIITGALIATITTIAYNSSAIFNLRVNKAIDNVIHYKEDINSTSIPKHGKSLTWRLGFLENSFEIIKSNPIIGVGTGGFKEEYKKINQINTPNAPNTFQPHNMYVFVMTQFGIVGLMLFLSIFYIQITTAIKSTNIFTSKVGLALPILFLIIMLSDSYLLGHYTKMLFILFSAIAYKKYPNLY